MAAIKSSGCVAILDYYCVVPFFNEYTVIPKIFDALPEGTTREQLYNAINWGITTACTFLQAKLFDADGLRDDGLVICHPVVYDTHVDMYLRLPATISIHAAMKAIRLDSAVLMCRTILALYGSRHRYLLSTRYAACSSVLTYGASITHESVYKHYLDAFRLENNLQVSVEETLKRERQQLSSSASMMPSNISIFK